MLKMTDAQVLNRAEILTRRHRSEWSRLVDEVCVGRSMHQVAKLLDRPVNWVKEHLVRSQVEDAAGVRQAHMGVLQSTFKREEIREVMKQFAPEEPDEEYVIEYESWGYTPEVAKCLATSYEAAEKAIKAGVIQETVNKQNERVSQILFSKRVD